MVVSASNFEFETRIFPDCKLTTTQNASFEVKSGIIDWSYGQNWSSSIISLSFLRKCSGSQLIKCMSTSISITKCPLTLNFTGSDLGEGCRGRAPPCSPQMACCFLKQVVCRKKKRKKLFLSGAPLQDPPLFTIACDEISRFTDTKCLSCSTPRVDKAVNLILALKLAKQKV